MRDIEPYWIANLSGSGVTHLCLKDSVGVLGVRPAAAPALWESWRRVADATGLRLWANCETFEAINSGNRNPLVAATFPRLLFQLEAATHIVDKILTWDAPSSSPRTAPFSAPLLRSGRILRQLAMNRGVGNK